MVPGYYALRSFLENRRAWVAAAKARSRPGFNGWAALQRGHPGRQDESPDQIAKDYMAVKIRMKRIGTKNTPVFRIVVADGRSPRDGKFIEELGTYQPLKKGDNFTLNLERAKYWIEKGAQPSETAASFIKKASKAAGAAA